MPATTTEVKSKIVAAARFHSLSLSYVHFALQSLHTHILVSNCIFHSLPPTILAVLIVVFNWCAIASERATLEWRKKHFVYIETVEERARVRKKCSNRLLYRLTLIDTNMILLTFVPIWRTFVCIHVWVSACVRCVKKKHSASPKTVCHLFMFKCLVALWCKIKYAKRERKKISIAFMHETKRCKRCTATETE